MLKLRIIRAYTVQAENGPSYTKGQTVELNELSAEHLIRRGVAELLGDEDGDDDVAFPNLNKGAIKGLAKLGIETLESLAEAVATDGGRAAVLAVRGVNEDKLAELFGDEDGDDE